MTRYQHPYLILQAYADAFECYCDMALHLMLSERDEIMPNLSHICAGSK